MNLTLVRDVIPSRSVRVIEAASSFDSVKLKNENWCVSKSNLEKVSSRPSRLKVTVSGSLSSQTSGKEKFSPLLFGNKSSKMYSAYKSPANRGA